MKRNPLSASRTRNHRRQVCHSAAGVFVVVALICLVIGKHEAVVASSALAGLFYLSGLLAVEHPNAVEAHREYPG